MGPLAAACLRFPHSAFRFFFPACLTLIESCSLFWHFSFCISFLLPFMLSFVRSLVISASRAFATAVHLSVLLDLIRSSFL